MTMVNGRVLSHFAKHIPYPMGLHSARGKKSPFPNLRGPWPQNPRVQARASKISQLHCYHYYHAPPLHISSISSSSPPVACSAAARSDLSMDPRRLSVLLFLLLVSCSAAAAFDEIHGCGGFVEVSVPHAARSPCALRSGSLRLVTLMGLGVLGLGCRRAPAWPSRGRHRTPSSTTPTSRYAGRALVPSLKLVVAPCWLSWLIELWLVFS